MKKLFYLLFASLISVNVQAQFVLTPNNFVLESDNSKNALVIPFEGTSLHDLYKYTRSYLESLFNNPQKVLNCTEDEQITVDWEGSNFSVSGGFSWAEYAVNYKYTIEFKEGKIRFIPYFKYVLQHGGQSSGKQIDLIGSNFMSKSAVFNKKGKCIFSKAKEKADSETNGFVKALTAAINKAKQDSDW